MTNSMDSAGFAMASATAAMNSQTFGAQVVSKTLDYMNSGSGAGMSSQAADYDFQTSVLSAAYTGKGSLANNMV